MTDYKAKTAYKNKEVAENYDRIRFTSAQGKLLDKIERQAVSYLIKKIDKPGLMLDLASGSGRFANLAVTSGHSVISADISVELLRTGRKRFETQPNFIGSVLCDAEKLPFKNDAFDCVVAIRFMGLLPPRVKQAVLTEVRQVTRRWAILNFHTTMSTRVIKKLIQKLRRQKPDIYPVSWRALRKDLKTIGFKVAGEVTPLLIPPRRFPRIFLPVIEMVNLLGNHLPIGYFSEQYFLLLEKV